jgi:hypothetical protein
VTRIFRKSDSLRLDSITKDGSNNCALAILQGGGVIAKMAQSVQDMVPDVTENKACCSGVD